MHESRKFSIYYPFFILIIRFNIFRIILNIVEFSDTYRFPVSWALPLYHRKGVEPRGCA